MSSVSVSVQVSVWPDAVSTSMVVVPVVASKLRRTSRPKVSTSLVTWPALHSKVTWLPLLSWMCWAWRVPRVSGIGFRVPGCEPRTLLQAGNRFPNPDS